MEYCMEWGKIVLQDMQMNQGKELGCFKGFVKYINVKMDIIFFIYVNLKENDIFSEDMNLVKNY